MHLKLLPKEQFKKQKAAESLTGNKIADKTTKVSKTSPHNNSKTVTNEAEIIRLDKKIPKER